MAETNERHIRATLRSTSRGVEVSVDTIGEVTQGDAERVAISLLLTTVQQSDLTLMEYMEDVTARVILTEATQP